MNRLIRTCYIAATVSFISIAPITNAASQDECSIWLCLPGGFPPGCGSAFSAMKKRLKKLKSPLPSLSSCVVSGGDSMTYTYRPAAYIPERRVCTKWGANGGDNEFCFEWRIEPARYIKGQACHRSEGEETPAGCTLTFHYIEMFDNGAQVGETFYFR